jgi:hypothetical protein
LEYILSLLTQEIKIRVKEFFSPSIKISQATLKKYEELTLNPPPAIKFDERKSKFKGPNIVGQLR